MSCDLVFASLCGYAIMYILVCFLSRDGDWGRYVRF
jgi:hypothetical protein